MPRVPVLVHSAEVDDVASLERLWSEFRDLNGSALGIPHHPEDIAERVRERISSSRAVVEAGGRPTYRLAIASMAGAPVGFASLSVVDRGLMTDSSAVLVDVVHVIATSRKAGIGTSLLRAAVTFGDEIGASDVVVNVPSTSREVNRFYARQGFSPMVVRRSTTMSALRRRLGVEPRLDPRDATTDLTTIQRALRRRALLAPRKTPVR